MCNFLFVPLLLLASGSRARRGWNGGTLVVLPPSANNDCKTIPLNYSVFVFLVNTKLLCFTDVWVEKLLNDKFLYICIVYF